jgi:hypothetical protein
LILADATEPLIKNSTSDATLDNVLAGASKTGATPEDNYNCWGAAIAGSQGNTIENGVGIFVGGHLTQYFQVIIKKQMLQKQFLVKVF